MKSNNEETIIAVKCLEEKKYIYIYIYKQSKKNTVYGIVMRDKWIVLCIPQFGALIYKFVERTIKCGAYV